ncbi:hypothetical protein [uncultured Sphaerotilus sp.]|uniref:hypothetical protein n=1 Tax=uncultured Sphaerotilus sp. TaxID=474984 RepID=UPI0030CA299D
MELGTTSILVQLLLIFVLVALFAGRRRMRIHRDQRDTHPGVTAPLAAPWPAARPAAPALPPAPALADMPFSMQRAPAQAAPILVSEELLPPCFADTCADWAQVESGTAQAPITRFGLTDWSVQADPAVDGADHESSVLHWTLDTPAETARRARPVPTRSASAAMSCTIAPQVHQCA